MDGSGSGRDGSNRKSHSTYGSRDKHNISDGPDIHLGPESTLTSKDMQDRALDALKKTMSKPENMAVLKRLKTKEGVAEGSEIAVDRKTGKVYNPNKELDKLLSQHKAQFQGMAAIEKAQAKKKAPEKKGVAEGLGDTQKKIEDTILKLEQRLKFAKTPEQWDNIKDRIERLQAGLNRSKQGVAEAGNKPLEKSYFGMGDDSTPRDIKSQMRGASDNFVKSTADKDTGPIHSQVAKMQTKMAQSELRKRADHDRMATGTNEGEGKKPAQPEADYGDDYQDMVARVKKLAGMGPLKTVYDPAKRVYKNVPTAVQPKK
jgi:hypothetical protein